MADAGTNPLILDELFARRDEILALAARRGASNVRVFGSVARGEAGARSDVDFVVDLAPDRSLLDLGGLLMDLRELLGAEIEVVTEKALTGRVRRRILDDARRL
jgi:uncharacterized protein